MTKWYLVACGLVLVAAGCAAPPARSCGDVFGAATCQWHESVRNRDRWF